MNVTGSGAPVSRRGRATRRALRQLLRAARRHGWLDAIDVSVNGPEIAVSPILDTAAGVVTGAELKELGAAAAVRLVVALGGSVALDGDRLLVRLPVLTGADRVEHVLLTPGAERIHEPRRPGQPFLAAEERVELGRAEAGPLGPWRGSAPRPAASARRGRTARRGSGTRFRSRSERRAARPRGGAGRSRAARRRASSRARRRSSRASWPSPSILTRPGTVSCRSRP